MTSEVSFLLKRNLVYYLCQTGCLLKAGLMALSFVAALFIRGIIRFEFIRHNKLCQRLLKTFACVFTGKRETQFGLPFA
ncbi:MAG: hypothetical protein ACKVZH_29270 [Blastocatellia bacterium]